MNTFFLNLGYLYTVTYLQINQLFGFEEPYKSIKIPKKVFAAFDFQLFMFSTQCI